VLVSVVIRTLNEEKHLEELLQGIAGQKLDGCDVETVIIDSGSKDRTLEIAEKWGCRITHIDEAQFTFGRSLNMGSKFANGDVLVYISGHCIPTSDTWLVNLTKPVIQGLASYSYGRQIGRDTTKFSEVQIFRKYFPDDCKIPQEGFFVNNANSALLRSTWKALLFDEDVTGLEDMELAKRLCDAGQSVAYVATAAVYHIHHETWQQTRRRYEREAIALQKIMPEIHVDLLDTMRFYFAGVFSDLSEALKAKHFLREFVSIFMFRAAQFMGTYRGNHEHRTVSKARKHQYYYPTKGY